MKNEQEINQENLPHLPPDSSMVPSFVRREVENAGSILLGS